MRRRGGVRRRFLYDYVEAADFFALMTSFYQLSHILTPWRRRRSFGLTCADRQPDWRELPVRRQLDRLGSDQETQRLGKAAPMPRARAEVLMGVSAESGKGAAQPRGGVPTLGSTFAIEPQCVDQRGSKLFAPALTASTYRIQKEIRISRARVA